jgi:hypothetical protein
MQKEAFIQQTLEVVELDSIAGQIVGIPGMFGLSGEQFKRLTIAVELVAGPSIIFMDEPTSGVQAHLCPTRSFPHSHRSSRLRGAHNFPRESTDMLLNTVCLRRHGECVVMAGHPAVPGHAPSIAILGSETASTIHHDGIFDRCMEIPTFRVLKLDEHACCLQDWMRALLRL